MADEIANLGPAIRTYLRESTVLAHADYLGSNNKIYINFPSNINVPPYQNLIVIYTGRGGRGDIGLGREEERVDMFCYGTDDKQCKKIWRALHEYFFPMSERRKTSFRREGCQVNIIFEESGPLTLTDPDKADWPYTVMPLIFQYNKVPYV